MSGRVCHNVFLPKKEMCGLVRKRRKTEKKATLSYPQLVSNKDSGCTLSADIPKSAILILFSESNSKFSGFKSL